MKLLDIINEDYTPEQLKELKEAKTVFLFFKKGTVNFKNTYNKKEYNVKYELGEPKFTWSPAYNPDEKEYNDFRVGVNDLTVNMSDQDLYDDTVTNPISTQDVYGQLVYNFILPKIKKLFIRHKVRIYISIRNVNFILSQPKKSEEPEVINEDFTPNAEQLEELKNAKAVYLAHKTGTIKYERSVSFVTNEPGPDGKPVVMDKVEINANLGYKLGEPKYEWRVNPKNMSEMYVSVLVKNITVYIKDPALYDAIVVNADKRIDHWIPLVHHTVRPTLTKRFNLHGVKLHVNEANVDFVLVEPKEPETINEEVSDNDKKKCRILFDQFKSGIVTLDDQKYKYYLKNEYEIMNTQYTPMPVIEIIGRFDNSIRVYKIVDNGHLTLMDYGIYNTIYSKIKQKVKKRFNLHNVLLNL